MGVAGHFSHGLRDGGGQSAARVPFGGEASARRVDRAWGMSWKRGSSARGGEVGLAVGPAVGLAVETSRGHSQPSQSLPIWPKSAHE